MPFHVDGPAFSVALVRIALALYLLSAGLAMAGLPMPTPAQGQPWLPAGKLGALTPVIVSALLACGALLVAGIESALVALAVSPQSTTGIGSAHDLRGFVSAIRPVPPCWYLLPACISAASF